MSKCTQMSAADAYEWEEPPEFIWSTRKNGKRGTRRICNPAWWTKLSNCEICGVIGGPKKIKYRSDIYGWDTPIHKRGNHPENYQHSKCMVCMSCRNKAWPAVKTKKGIEECQYLLKQLTKEITNVKARTKDKDHR